MGKEYRKQHVIPRTYLKHFSLNDDGKNLFVMDFTEDRRSNIRKVDSGHRIFWKENYYDSIRFRNRKTIEKSFKLTENIYDKIIKRVLSEEPISEQWIKDELPLFIFFAVHRSPAERFSITRQVEFESWLSKVYPSIDNLMNFDEKNREFIAKELHLSVWSEPANLEETVNDVIKYLRIKKWEIFVAPEGKYWVTSDNPCVEYKFDDNNKSIVPVNIWNFKKLEAMFVPLTKKYCLHIQPYGPNDDQNINLNESLIEYKIATAKDVLYINRFSLLTMHKLLISPDIESHHDLLLYTFSPTR